MTTTALDTTEDLLRAARENVEFREAFRREILTEELLELPQRFAEYSSATDRKIEALTDNVSALTNNVNALTKRVDDLTTRVDDLTTRVDDLTKRVDDLTKRVDDLTTRVDALTVTVDSLVKGIAEYKEATNQRLDNIARDISSLHGMYAQQHDD